MQIKEAQQLSRSALLADPRVDQHIRVFLSYNPPFDWVGLRNFFRRRQLDGNELLTEHSIAKCIVVDGHQVSFLANHNSQKNGFDVQMQVEDERAINPAISVIRKLLDLDADPTAINHALLASGLPKDMIIAGIRLPRIINKFEGACRAVVGQQVSVKAAVGQLNLLAYTLGSSLHTSVDCDDNAQTDKIQRQHFETLQPFLTPLQVLEADVSFLKMPNARKQSLLNIATLLHEKPNASEEEWLALKGIGPWTVNYVKLRYADVPDIFLDSDLIIKQQTQKLAAMGIDLQSSAASPYRSYLTLNLWNNA